MFFLLPPLKTLMGSVIVVGAIDCSTQGSEGILSQDPRGVYAERYAGQNYTFTQSSGLRDTNCRLRFQ